LRQRKEGVFKEGYIIGMDTNIVFEAQMTVEDTLKLQPKIWMVFMSRQMSCSGCFMQRFCTLQDVAATYQISLPKLLEDLNKGSQTQSYLKG
jgi:hybrid cluster-associated redox disulfide protein